MIKTKDKNIGRNDIIWFVIIPSRPLIYRMEKNMCDYNGRGDWWEREEVIGGQGKRERDCVVDMVLVSLCPQCTPLLLGCASM